MRSLASLIAAAAATAFLGTSADAQVLKQEPPMGSIRAGETVLVDNGKCPKGHVMAVTGGNHIKAGGKNDVVRTRKCVKASS